MKKENSSKEFYLQRLNKNQSNSQKNPLKFLAFYVGRSKNRKQHVGGCKGKDNVTVIKLLNVLSTEKKLSECSKQYKIFLFPYKLNWFLM